jgi:hypothetical protein
MKNHEIDAPVNPLRRRLLLGTPAGLVLASPLALLACGGSDDETAAAPAGNNSSHDSGRAFAGNTDFSSVSIGVEVPAGVVVPAGGLAVHTMLGGFGVVGAGSAVLRTVFAGPQLATLYTAHGLPMLFGFVGEGLPPISAHSTATALISLAIGTEWVEGSTSRAWIAEIHASPAASVLADVITAALAADVYAVASRSAAIDAGLVAAVRALLPATATSAADGRARPLGLTINPPNNASGVQPLSAETVNSVYVQNEKLRRAWYVIRREGYVSADGTAVPETARPSLAEGDIPMLPGFDSAGDIIGKVTEALYSNDGSGLAFSRTEETNLPLSPDDARNTVYSVTVLMAGNAALGYDEAAFAKLRPTERLKVDMTLFSPDNLTLQTLVIDMLVPMFLSWLGGKIGDQGAGASPREFKQKIHSALMGQILVLFTATLPEVVAKMKDPINYRTYGSWDVLHDIVSAHLIVMVEVPVPGRATPVSLPTLSTFSIEMLMLLLKFLAYERMNAANGEALLNFLEGDANNQGASYTWNVGGKSIGFDRENLRFAGVSVAMSALGTVENILGAASKSRMLADLATSRLIETWELKAVKPKLRLTPSPFEVAGPAITYPLTLEIVDNDNDAYGIEKGSFRFDWECTAHYGDLFKRTSAETNKFSTSNTNPTVDYVARTTVEDAGPETVTVAVYFEPIGSSKPSELIGTVSTTVKFKKAFNLAMSPAELTLFPADTDMVVTAFFKEKLPADSTVAWEWSHAGAGAIASLPADSNPADSKVKFQSGSTEGSATITVRATVDVPATADKAAYRLAVDPVSMTVQVKKGLKTITFNAGGGVFGCTDPKACGVSEYTAFVVPRFEKAVLYQAVLSGYAYAGCNRSVTWNSVVGDGGGCNFPVTYFPHSSVQPTDSWAVWIGFGGAFSGKCEVTVTLAP